MNDKIFKKLQCDNCYINIAQFNIFDVIIPGNSVIYCDSANSTLYICTHFPNYSGNPANINLHVIWYDYEMCTIGDTFLHNDISSAMFVAWDCASRPRSKKVVHHNTFADYENMMKHDRKKKSSSGGVRLMKDCEYTTDNLRYKQVTESAYWANLSNCKSGNASVVASNIR